MRVKQYIYCNNFKKTFHFYKNIMPPSFEVELYEPGKLVVMDFFFLIRLVILEKTAPPAELFFYDVSIKKLHQHLEAILPDDEDTDNAIKNGHRRGIYEHPGGLWMSFADPSGNTFYFEQSFNAERTASTALPEFDAKQIILTA